MDSMRDLDAIARKYDTRRWPSVVHMNGRLMAPKETPDDVAALIAELRAARAVVEAARYADADAPDPWRKFSTAMDGLRSTLRKYDAQRG